MIHLTDLILKWPFLTVALFECGSVGYRGVITHNRCSTIRVHKYD